MIRLLGRLVALFLLLVLLTIGGVAIWIAYERRRDPMVHLDRGPAAYRIRQDMASTVVTQSGERRIFRELELDGGLLEAVRFTVSLPAQVRPSTPALILLGGRERGRERLAAIGHHGANVLVAYAYPEAWERWWRGRIDASPRTIRRSLLEAPSQVETVLAWVTAQAWCDPSRVSLLGYGPGALLLPAAQHLAQRHGRRLGPTVVAYGGADLPSLLEASLEERPWWLREALGKTVDTLLHPLEPAVHMSHLQGAFLFINGKRDLRVRPPSALRLQQLAPGPKEVVWLEAGSLGAEDVALFGEVLHISRKWLMARGALAP